MGSPIDTWEGAGPIFTGAGGASPTIFLVLAIAICVGLIVRGAIYEEKAYKKHE